MVGAIASDLRFALRSYRRSAGLTTAVILTFTFGIGANTAIFSFVDQLLLRPLPYPSGERLVLLDETYFRERNSAVSPANWLDWQRQSKSFESLAAWNTTAATLTGDGDPERLNGQLVSAEFFPLLGVAPLLGRVISAEDDRPDAAPVVVLSHRLWQRRFSGEPHVVGKIIQLNEGPVEVVGVMPSGFQFVYHDTDIWRPFRLDRNRNWRLNGRFMHVVGRVRSTGTLEATRAEMVRIARDLESLYPAYNKNTGVAVVPLREELTGQVRTSLLVVYAAVGVLLLIACCNIASLLLARSASRQPEIAVRSALGAGRGAIVRQCLIEVVFLAGIGGLIGVALAQWATTGLLAVLPAGFLPITSLNLDVRILVYATVLSSLTGLAVGLAPALSLARRSVFRGGFSFGRATHAPRGRQALVVGQVALTVVLLAGAGLLVRSISALSNTRTGVDATDVLTMQVGLPPRYADFAAVQFFRRTADDIRQVPGVEAVGAADSLPVIGAPRSRTGFHILGAPAPTGSDRPSTLVRVATPGYFRTVGIRVQRGRDFAQVDLDEHAAPVFIVNEAFATSYFPARDPLTASISVAVLDENPYGAVVGVVSDVSEGSFAGGSEPTVFYVHRHMAEDAMTLFVRGRNATALRRSVLDVIRAVDPNIPVTGVQMMEAAFADSLTRERLTAIVSGAFAAGALLLASLGLYGVLAFSVSERTREIGLRIALGAPWQRVMSGIMVRGFLMVGAGMAIGVIGTLLASKLFARILFSVTPYDPWTYVAVLLLLGTVAAAAIFAPARRAALVDPILALRQQ
jgi:putative ABC transport system permease protein